MPDIKLIVTDLDDTFLDGEYAPDMNVTALKHAREAGIRVIPCTGRPWLMTEPVVKGYDFDNLCVVSNGASIIEMDSGTLRYRNRLAPEVLLPLLRIGEKYGVGFDVSCTDRMAMLDSQLDVKRGRLYDLALDQLAEQGKLVSYKTVEDMAEGCSECAELVRFFISKGADIGRKLAADFSEMHGIELARSYKYHIDIMAEGAGKGSVLPILADIYGISMDNIMALGDQLNDASMLEMAGLGVAVGNADDRLKQVADHVTDTNKNAGFAKAVYEFALNR